MTSPSVTPPTRRALLRGAAAAAALALPAIRRPAAEAAARVSLIHLNDFHSRHEPVEARSAAGCRADADAAACLGGSPRLAGAVAAARRAAAAEGRAPLAFDAGDQFMGSLFYTHYRGEAELAVMRAWGCEAMAPGNHEFDNGPENLARFAAAAPFPLLAANLDTGAEPALDGRIQAGRLFGRGGARIALIGLITEDTPNISSPGPRLRFTDPEAAAERAAAMARSAGGAGPVTVVLLSHCGLAADRRLAGRVRGIDVIIGGHSHTLLADGLPEAAGPHPLVVDGPDRPVRIVQAGAFGRWLGRLDLDLAPDGRVAAHGGACRPVGPDAPEDAAVAGLVARLAAPLEETRRRPVARTAAAFGIGGCRSGECALGDLLAEAMLAAAPTAEVALHNGGGMRAGLPEGAVSLGDLLTVLPFGNTLAVLRLRGADLRAALENGLSGAPAPSGRFPQVAGLRLRWNPAAPPGRRVEAVEVAERGTGRFVPLDPERVYRIVTHSYLRRGGDGYAVLRDRALDAYDDGPPMKEAVAPYLAARSPLAPRTDGRIAASR
ncbi:multifunctional 2',3'-cyclic-nucleotide 2'-phosphodiesterase/5'-nucleotidase/3'-nucleotidase [Caldovatus sediminis]|uniref:Multifunctional 2',3'-cyclic-nucleotide 2'-phosphodiesterase/5'-nucleotidase/3'-nucleotidase n=1 Tax=Caldovatus sediminis TaxID=2041189 RepID=A0A8J2ZDP6_9PROT|nr:5'-nucleotidase C-terminal domain-containing protein [Caldovatus sediminis]GGG42533.1 multifunctional 2',3'-cyclic-nucleotide 2'-phosphodiesterase/5'-nucleotidase/3'-nucleotidase [Caldovatus sediminis]